MKLCFFLIWLAAVIVATAIFDPVREYRGPENEILFRIRPKKR
jgi:hypothetical protein